MIPFVVYIDNREVHGSFLELGSSMIGNRRFQILVNKYFVGTLIYADGWQFENYNEQKGISQEVLAELVGEVIEVWTG